MGCGRAAVRAAVEGDWPFVTVGQRPKEAESYATVELDECRMHDGTGSL
jgi:hypothetical protein